MRVGRVICLPADHYWSSTLRKMSNQLLNLLLYGLLSWPWHLRLLKPRLLNLMQMLLVLFLCCFCNSFWMLLALSAPLMGVWAIGKNFLADWRRRHGPGSGPGSRIWAWRKVYAHIWAFNCNLMAGHLLSSGDDNNNCQNNNHNSSSSSSSSNSDRERKATSHCPWAWKLFTLRLM